MRPFLHQRLRRIDELISASNLALQAYLEQNPSLANIVTRFFEQAGATYHRLGLSDGENELLALGAQFAAARHGIDPVSLERRNHHRRELERAVAVHVLQAGAARIRADGARFWQTFDDTTERLLPIVAVGIQKGLIPLAANDPDAVELETIWRSLLDDRDLQAAARPIAMTIAQPDVVIIIADLLAGLSSGIRLATADGAFST